MIDEAFKKYVKVKKTKHGYEANCRKGFFGVTAPTREEAEREARHYFVQYYLDGEYLDPVEMFMKIRQELGR